MEIYMRKIGLIRDDINPKNTNLNLNIDWFVEYSNTDQDEISQCDYIKIKFVILFYNLLCFIVVIIL